MMNDTLPDHDLGTLRTFCWPDGEYLTGYFTDERYADLNNVPFCAADPPCDVPPGIHCEHCGCTPCTTRRAEVERILAANSEMTTSEPEPDPQQPAGYPKQTRDPWWAAPDMFVGIGEKHPALLTRDDGETILYAHCFNWVAGRWAGGKSWIGLIAAINAPRTLYWDSRTSRRRSVSERSCLARSAMCRTTTCSGTHAATTCWPTTATASTPNGSTLPKRSTGSATASSSSTRSARQAVRWTAADVRPWIRDYIEPWRKNAAPTIVVIDHLAKAKDRAPGPIGSQHRAAASDGAVLSISGRDCWNKNGDDRQITIVLEKDRHGELPATAGRAVATIRGTWWDGGFAYTIIKPKDTTASPDDDLHRQLLEAIGSAEGGTILYANGIRKAVGGCGHGARLAAERLAQAGLIEKIRHGKGWAYTITMVGEDALRRHPETHRMTRLVPCPTLSRTTLSLVPTPKGGTRTQGAHMIPHQPLAHRQASNLVAVRKAILRAQRSIPKDHPAQRHLTGLFDRCQTMYAELLGDDPGD